MSFDVNEYTKGAWLKGSDLEEGERLIVTISAAYEYEFPSGDKRPVLEFSDHEQKLTLNKTRVRKLVELLGDDPEVWIGQRIGLYPVDVNFNGQTMPSVAVTRAPGKKQKPIKDVDFSDTDEDSPF